MLGKRFLQEKAGNEKPGRLSNAKSMTGIRLNLLLTMCLVGAVDLDQGLTGEGSYCSSVT